MKILVTGANGFLGFNLLKELLHNGFEVYALSRSPIDFFHPKLNVVLCDLININSTLKGVAIDVIFHTASTINFDETPRSISILTRDNIIATSILADFANNNGVSKFIHSSSCSVYDDNFNKNNFISEEQTLRPKNSYAVSKLSSEWILANRLIGSVEELIILRYSSIYGLGQKPNSILPIFIDKASKNIDLNLFGAGNRVQDYVHINSVVEANLRCLDVILPFHTILNIGSGQKITNLKLAEEIIDIWKSSSNINILNNKEIESYFTCDLIKAKELICYEPLSLSEGLTLYKNGSK